MRYIMKDKFKELFEYNYVMNLRVIELINAYYEQVSEKCISLLHHTLNAHQIWNARIINRLQHQVWQINDWNDVISINESNYQLSIQIVATEDLHKAIQYANSKGDVFENRVEDILLHIINHSTYHRAQIATECRNSGIEPLSTDYIMYKR